MLNLLLRCQRAAPSLLRTQPAGFVGVSPAGVYRRVLRVKEASRCCHEASSSIRRQSSPKQPRNSLLNTPVDGGHQETSRQSSSVDFSLHVLVSLLRQENAVDICVIQTPAHLQYAQYLVVVSGISTRHLHAMALYAVKVYKYFKKQNEPNVKIEGKDSEDWMCIDFGNMVVHLMLPETRELYELEKLWTLRGYDEQLMKIPPETLPQDFICDDLEVTK